jgi:hypothetical protein
LFPGLAGLSSRRQTEVKATRDNCLFKILC